MTLAVEKELAEAGVAATRVEVVSEQESAAGITVGLALPEGYAWLERRATADPEVDRATVAALRGALGNLHDDADVASTLPFVTDRGVAVYRSLPGPALLVGPALLAGDGDTAGWRRLPADTRRLGAHLARLHHHGRDHPPPPALIRSTAGVTRVEGLLRPDAGPLAPPSLDRLRQLFDDADPGLAEALLEAIGPAARRAAPTLLHGQYAPGFVVAAADPGDQRLAVIGWLEAGTGPPAVDVGTFVGELVELAFAWGAADLDRAATLDEAARRFLQGYASAADQGGLDDTIAAVGAQAAVKIVDHLSLHCTYFGFPGESARVMLSWARAALDRDWTEVL